MVRFPLDVILNTPRPEQDSDGGPTLERCCSDTETINSPEASVSSDLSIILKELMPVIPDAEPSLPGATEVPDQRDATSQSNGAELSGAPDVAVNSHLPGPSIVKGPRDVTGLLDGRSTPAALLAKSPLLASDSIGALDLRDTPGQTDGPRPLGVLDAPPLPRQVPGPVDATGQLSALATPPPLRKHKCEKIVGEMQKLLWETQLVVRKVRGHLLRKSLLTVLLGGRLTTPTEQALVLIGEGREIDVGYEALPQPAPDPVPS
jgi:hypothetical protein